MCVWGEEESSIISLSLSQHSLILKRLLFLPTAGFSYSFGGLLDVCTKLRVNIRARSRPHTAHIPLCADLSRENPSLPFDNYTTPISNSGREITVFGEHRLRFPPFLLLSLSLRLSLSLPPSRSPLSIFARTIPLFLNMQKVKGRRILAPKVSEWRVYRSAIRRP